MTPQAELFPFINALSERSIAKFYENIKTYKFANALQLIKRGDLVEGVYLVTKGALRIYYINAQGREGTLYWIEPGQTCILALNCTFSGIEYPAWVETEGDVEITVIPNAFFKELFGSEASVQKFAIDALSSRLFDLMAMVEETATSALETRIARFIYRRAVSSPVIKITQAQISRHLATSREVVSRLLKRLVDAGLIKVETGSIKVTKLEKLKQYIS